MLFEFKLHLNLKKHFASWKFKKFAKVQTVSKLWKISKKSQKFKFSGFTDQIFKFEKS